MTRLSKLLTAKVIWGSQSSWSAPIIVVPKGDGGKQLVIDYHALNKITWKFIWPMPEGRRHFCPTQWCEILLNPGSMSRISPHPFGWVINTKNSLHLTIWKIWILQGTLQTHSSTCIFPGTHWQVSLKDFPFAIAYLDDIIIFSRMHGGTPRPHQASFQKIMKC